jgi:multiple sugar transport system permease protein
VSVDAPDRPALSAEQAAPQQRRAVLARRDRRAAYLFVSPWLVGLLLLTGGPIVASLVLSFTDYDLLSSAQFVGTENYQAIVQDDRALTAMRNTLLLTALHVPVAVLLALGLALLLARATRRTAGVYRTLFYLPSVTPPVAIGVLFLLVLNGQVGLVNRALALVGIDGPEWTTDPAWIVPGLVVMSLWSVGTTTVILYAALLDVPRQLLEAAAVDGAGAWARTRYVTIPMISGALFFSVIVVTIGDLQSFTEAYTMYFGTSSAGGADSALLFVIYLFQQGFQYLHMGYASALAWILFLVIAAITAVQAIVGSRFVHYEGDR